MAKQIFPDPTRVTRNGAAVAIVLVVLGLLWYSNRPKPNPER